MNQALFAILPMLAQAAEVEEKAPVPWGLLGALVAGIAFLLVLILVLLWERVLLLS